MNTPKSTLTPTKPAAPASGIIASWVNFWFAPVDPVGLHALRVLAGLLFLFWLLPLAGQQQALFGLDGLFDAKAYVESSRLPDLPPHLFGWSATYLSANPVVLGVIFWVSIAAVVLFTLGVATRFTGVLTWVAVVSYTANPAISYDADPLLLMLAFYLMIGYLLLGQWGAGRSLLTRLLGPRETWLFHRPATGAAFGSGESVGANLALRLFQVHFAIAMVASGLHKLQVKEWWNGLAPWFYLNTPFGTTAERVQAYRPSPESYLTLFTLAAYLVLAWQFAFPAFAWRRGAWRAVLLGGAAVGWLACAFWVSLPLFGPILVVSCLGFLSAGEWRWLQSFVAEFPGVRSVLRRLSRVPDGSVLAGPKSGAVARAAAVSVGQR
ncbi:MAG TPA: hypothetical protein VKA46_01250 [Gemmataceae bacterium]|nr:hypothetical protein [Gemmataceae bacterium]